MGLFDIFKDKKDEENFDPLRDLELSKLKFGHYVDCDMKSWEVTILRWE